MQKVSTRRNFIQIFPLAGMAMIAACSEKPAPAPAPAPEPVAPPPPAPEPAPAPAPEPAAAPAAETPPPAAEPAPAATAAPAGGMPMADPKSTQATMLGYVENAANADKAKYKTFVAGSNCANCGLFQGKADDKAGGCPLFPGQQVAAAGWCSAWVKKAA